MLFQEWKAFSAKIDLKTTVGFNWY